MWCAPAACCHCSCCPSAPPHYRAFRRLRPPKPLHQQQPKPLQPRKRRRRCCRWRERALRTSPTAHGPLQRVRAVRGGTVVRGEVGGLGRVPARAMGLPPGEGNFVLRAGLRAALPVQFHGVPGPPAVVIVARPSLLHRPAIGVPTTAAAYR